MARYISKPSAAKTLKRNERTIENWIGEGYITGFRDAGGAILVDLDEIEGAFKRNPKMRDGRKPYGPKARIVPLPVAPVVAPEGGEQP